MNPLQMLAQALAQQAAAQNRQPLFTSEGPQYAARAYAHNRPFAKPGPYETVLPGGGMQEQQFRQWLAAKNVPFDPNEATPDYDMRGFFTSGQASSHVPGTHFPDTFKTPYDTSFSNQSQYATKDNPFAWQGNKLVDQRTGQVVYSDRGGR